MDNFSLKKQLPPPKTSIQYQPLYPSFHNPHHTPVFTGKKIDANTFFKTADLFAADKDNHFFETLAHSIQNMSISHQIWYSTPPFDWLFWDKDQKEWKSSTYIIRFAVNVLVASTCLILYILQILYFQDLKICRDFDSRFKPHATTNQTLCSFLDQCSLKSPLVNEWRLQEYAWLRIVLSSIQYVPFIFLFIVDWWTIRNELTNMGKHVREIKANPDYFQKGSNFKPSLSGFPGYDTKYYTLIFKFLVFFCCLVTGCIAFDIDYEAQKAGKECVYEFQIAEQNSKEPQNWAFFLPTQKAPYELPLVFLIFGSFFTFWSLIFVVYSLFTLSTKTKQTRNEKFQEELQNHTSTRRKHDQLLHAAAGSSLHPKPHE